MALMFRRDAYMWITSVLGSSNYQTLERAIEQQSGRIICQVHKTLCTRMDLADKDEKCDIQCLQQSELKIRGRDPVIVIPIKAGFGEVTAVLSAKRP